MTLLIGGLCTTWGLGVLLFAHTDEAERFIGDRLDSMYKALPDYGDIGEQEISSLTTRYIRIAYTSLVVMSAAMGVGCYTSGLLLGFRKVVKRFMQGVNMGLLAVASMDILASVYVYGYKTFVAEMNAEWFILSLIVLGVALAVVAVIGFYAVRFEHGLYLKMYSTGLLVLLGLFGTLGMIALVYRGVIPQRFEQLYKTDRSDQWVFVTYL